MQNNTETEKKVFKIVRESLFETLAREPHLSEMVERITITPFNFGTEMPEVVVFSVPSELLNSARLEYSKLMKGLKKVFSNATLLTMRAGEVVPKKSHNPLRSRENIVKDLVFPSAVFARTTEVESREEMKQLVLLDAKNQCWTGIELRAIEKVMSSILSEDFHVGIFGAAN